MESEGQYGDLEVGRVIKSQIGISSIQFDLFSVGQWFSKLRTLGIKGS